MSKGEVSFDELAKLFIQAAEHLDYCGYGDSYERSGTEGMRKQINEMMEKLKAMGV